MVMNTGPWWGKAAGASVGAIVGGWSGLLLGLLLGFLFDYRLRLEPFSARIWRGCRVDAAERQFLTACFALMGHLAKADGRVSEEEVAAAGAVMEELALDDGRRQRAIYLFTLGKQADFPLAALLRRFRASTRRRPAAAEQLLLCLLRVSLADGQPGAAQLRLLLRIAGRLRISPTRLDQLVRQSQQTAAPPPRRPSESVAGLSRALELLEVEADATPAEITRAYRRAIARHHPDRQQADADPAMLRRSGQRTREIIAAYEEIRRARGF